MAVLITGCSSGIGLDAAIRLKKEHINIIASARKPQDVDLLNKKGLKAVELDVNCVNSIHDALSKVQKIAPEGIQALVNNAGFAQVGALEDLSREQLRAQFETNVFGVQALTNAVLPRMREQGFGKIIMMSSILGRVSMRYTGAYCASKYALEGLSDSLRLELRDTNIWVSAIEPGPIHSEFRNNAYETILNTIDIENSPHKQAYLSMEKNFKREKENSMFTLQPEAVSKVILKILKAKRPKAYYPVTLPAHALCWLKRLGPTALLDYLLYKSSRA